MTQICFHPSTVYPLIESLEEKYPKIPKENLILAFTRGLGFDSYDTLVNVLHRQKGNGSLLDIQDSDFYEDLKTQGFVVKTATPLSQLSKIVSLKKSKGDLNLKVSLKVMIASPSGSSEEGLMVTFNPWAAENHYEMLTELVCGLSIQLFQFKLEEKEVWEELHQLVENVDPEFQYVSYFLAEDGSFLGLGG